MAKIVMIGAGSYVFSTRLISDFLSYPELRESTITLMDIDKERLNFVTTFAKKLVNQHRFKTKIESTTDRRSALDGADYVIVTIRVGGFEATKKDLEIPAKYGIKQAVGDTVGPAGVFYGLKHIPVLLDICHDMEDLCPDAWLLNYTNPMAMICWAINDYTHIKNVGLCHSVQVTARELAKYMNVPLEEISYWAAGINHMSWFLELKWRGKDAYPLLRERLKDPKVYSGPDTPRPDIARVELFQVIGYFSSESSPHLSEYVPYFRKRPELFERYKLSWRIIDLENIEKTRRKQEEEIRRQLDTGQELPIQRSVEYCSYIIYSKETDVPQRIYGNVKNTGLITNLLQGSCVEVPCLVDKSGIHPCYVGALPPQCAALNQSNINVQELGVKAAVEKDKTLVLQAILLDPLTSAVLTIDETRQMVDEMFKAEAEYLSGFK